MERRRFKGPELRRSGGVNKTALTFRDVNTTAPTFRDVNKTALTFRVVNKTSAGMV